MKKENLVRVKMESRSVNEAFARSMAGAYLMPFDPTLEELGDVKTAVSEAVTNAIVHAYPDTIGEIVMELYTKDNAELYIRILDKGCGIADIKQAMEPLFTTCSDEERSGLGFTMMQAFCDTVRVRSKIGKGTTVTLMRRISMRERNADK